ncbi:MAG: helix-turn-helix domain-containing protein [Ignavibacteriales bacterium]|nr:helix-turn-helix domain-containing protein [Ignavibacteriales bacterium]
MQQIITIQVELEEFKEIVKEIVTDVVKRQLVHNSSSEKEDELISMNQACLMLNVSKVTLWNYRKKKLIHARKIGRRVLFSKKELREATEHAYIGQALHN